MTIDYNEIRELIKTLAATDISEFSLKSADLELNIRKGTVNTALGPLAAPLPSFSYIPPSADISDECVLYPLVGIYRDVPTMGLHCIVAVTV